MRAFSMRAVAILGALSLILSACGELEELADVPLLKADDLAIELPETSKVYAANRSVITRFHGEQNRTVVPLGELPKRVWRSIVAIEDERFFEHEGVDLKAIVRAAVANVKSGDVQQGGSTITQQYVKNVIIAPNGSPEQSLQRKVEEAALARQVENRLSKRQILERYINTVYFGNGAYGVEAAARTYFGKSARKVSAKEAATIAGFIRNPSYYDPYRFPKRAKRRRNLVADKMADLGWLGPERTRKLSDYPLGVRPEKSKRYPAPYFIDYVKRLLTFHPRFDMLGKDLGTRTKALFEGGLEIHTTLDRKMQKSAERAIEAVLTKRRDPHGALVAIDPRNGHVKAMVGGRNFFAGSKTKRKRGARFAKLNLAITGEPRLGRVGGAKRTVNRAPGTGRQAGSAFKPFALATGLADGVPLHKTYEAKECKTFPTADNGGPWNVCNYGGASYGRATLLEGTVKSINVVYAQLILELGANGVVETAKDMGIGTDLLAVPSAVLGTNPVNALGMASAFGTLATNGIARRPVAITKVVDGDGRVVFAADPQSRRVLDAGVAYATTQTLEQVIQNGTGTAARIGRPAAGKTGTAQEYRDAWFVGYTPDLVASVWVGYPRASISMKTYCPTDDRMECRPTRIQVAGGTWPAQIWQRFMTAALKGTPAREFDVPTGAFVRVVIDIRSGCLAQSYTPDRYKRTVLLVADAGKPERCAPPPPPPRSSDDGDGNNGGGNGNNGGGNGNNGNGGGNGNGKKDKNKDDDD